MFDKANRKFSVYRRFLSFKYAFSGILQLIKYEHNAWIHLLAAIFVVGAGIYFRVTNIEWVALVFAIGLVLSAEAFNSAIEMLVDKISPQFDEKAGKIKDLAAGAVLIAAIAAAIVGSIIFAPYLN